MKYVTIAITMIAIILSGCEKVSNTVIISDFDGNVQSAEVQLCESQFKLNRFEHRFRAEIPIKCEGQGKVLLRLSSGKHAFCRIGYVTPGIKQSFHFSMRDGRCEALVQ